MSQDELFGMVDIARKHEPPDFRQPFLERRVVAIPEGTVPQRVIVELDSQRVKISGKGLAAIALGLFVSTVVLLEVDLWAGLLCLAVLGGASFVQAWRRERALVNRLRMDLQLLQRML